MIVETERRIKYPRTFHMPTSQGITNDDKVMTESDLSALLEKSVVISEKMDGENSTLYSFCLHARSIDSKHHNSRSWLKGFHSTISEGIPEGWRICGENMFAKHSIKYTDLESYFYGFSIWTDKNFCLPWWETLDWFELLGIPPVKVLHHGLADRALIDKIIKSLNLDRQEGIVIRSSNGFHYDDFSKNVCKWVREGHVQTDEHWMFRDIEINQLVESH